MYEFIEAPSRPPAGDRGRRAFAPSAPLAPFVLAFEVVEASGESTRTLFPDLGLAAGIRYRGAATLLGGASSRPVPAHALTGMRSTVRQVWNSADGGIVLAKFTEVGAAQFLDVPLHELHGEMPALDEFFAPSAVDRLSSRIAGASGDGERVALLERFLLAHLRPEPPDPLALAAVRALLARRGSLRITELARGLHVGQDALEKRFRRAVGATPKQFASLLRLRHAVASYRRGGSLGRLALESGYYDQSHFNRDFRAATGQAPRAFFARLDRPVRTAPAVR